MREITKSSRKMTCVGREYEGEEDMGEKLKNAIRGHKEKKKNRSGGFSYMLASFIIHKRGVDRDGLCNRLSLVPADDELCKCKL